MFTFFCIAQVLAFALFPAKTSKVIASVNTMSKSSKPQLELPSIALTHEPREDKKSLVFSNVEESTFVAPIQKPTSIPSYIYAVSKPSPTGDIDNLVLSMGGDSKLVKIMHCESGGNPRAFNASSGAAGLFQFLTGTWRGMGGSTYSARDASVEEQIHLGVKLYNHGIGARNWVCTYKV